MNSWNRFLASLILIWTSLRNSEPAAYAQISQNVAALRDRLDWDGLKSLMIYKFGKDHPTQSAVKKYVTEHFDIDQYTSNKTVYTDPDTNLKWNWAVLDLPKYVSYKLRNPDNLQALRDYVKTPDFMLRHGEIHQKFQQDILQKPSSSTATSVLPVFFQLHMDGVTVRREMHVRQTSLLHGNITLYNLGEQYRRMSKNRIRIFLTNSSFPKRVCDRKYPKRKISLRGARPKNRKELCAAEKSRLWKVFFEALGQQTNEWFEGFDYELPSGETVYIRLICTSCVFDLPQISEATGQVCSMHHSFLTHTYTHLHTNTHTLTQYPTPPR